MELALILTAAGSLLAAASCVVMVRRSLPVKLTNRLHQVDRQLATYEEHFDALAGNWRSHKIEVEHCLEQLEQVAETVERKRKRISAEESARKRREGNGAEVGELDPNDRASWIKRAREMGVPGI